MGRLMGLDFGAHTVGVALSDELGMIAHEHVTVKRERESKLRRTLSEIDALCREFGVERIVVGLPLNVDDSMSERAHKSRDFAEQVERRTGIKTVLYDERFTTSAARDILDESGIKRSEQKRVIDQVAAAIILQDYLDNQFNEGK